MKWIVDIEVDQTKVYYDNERDGCDCIYCVNYLEASKHFGAKIIDVFHKLGVQSSKPSHLSEYGMSKDGLRLYNGSYHIVGRVIEGPFSTNNVLNKDNTFPVDNFIFTFEKEVSFVPEKLPEPIIQLDFEARVPWVLNEKPDDE